MSVVELELTKQELKCQNSLIDFGLSLRIIEIFISLDYVFQLSTIGQVVDNKA